MLRREERQELVKGDGSGWSSAVTESDLWKGPDPEVTGLTLLERHAEPSNTRGGREQFRKSV